MRIGIGFACQFVVFQFNSRLSRTIMATAPRKTPAKKKAAPKNSLVANINKKKKAGTSKPKSESTVDTKSYKKLKEGWDKK